MAIRSTDKRRFDEVSDVEDNTRSSKVKRGVAPFSQQQVPELHSASETTPMLEANQASPSDARQELPLRPLKQVESESARKDDQRHRASKIHSESTKKAHLTSQISANNLSPSLDEPSPMVFKSKFELPVKLSKKTGTSTNTTASSKPQDPKKTLGGLLSQPSSSLKPPKATPKNSKPLPDGLLALPSKSGSSNLSFLPKKLPRTEHESATSKQGKKKPDPPRSSSPPPAPIGHGKNPWTAGEIDYLQLYYTMLIVKASNTPIEIPMLKQVREDFNAYFAGRTIDGNVYPRRTVASTTAKVNNVCMELKQRLEDIHTGNWDAGAFEKYRPIISQKNIDRFGAAKGILDLKDSQAVHPELEKLVADMMELTVPTANTPNVSNGLVVIPSHPKVSAGKNNSAAVPETSE